ncbi:acetyl-CoA hydrolase/transferase C-terminal domain-containing protein [Allohahella marinimesophila]|uniref:Acetyl-CoA hydrolase/transferase C-terminal domain-containing protein n=1 Tax=Allohahella marinimesophila TaxID=1054972 RepID=A0ABP7Q3Y7_9GAMM
MPKTTDAYAGAAAHTDVDTLIDELIATVGKRIVIGLPLGIGKATTVINALYQRALVDKTISLKIITALSLSAPKPKSELEARFLKAFLKRQYDDVVPLDYDAAVRSGKLPPNIEVTEFFLQAAGYLGNAYAQQHYISSNYTHVVRDLLLQGINVIAQYVARDPDHDDDTRPPQFSLSCNPDLTLDLNVELARLKAEGTPICRIAEINDHLPFMPHDAVVEADDFELILDPPAPHSALFAAPSMAVSPAEHMIGFYASSLLRDAGTLQIGIGSLGTALVHSTILRQHQNERYAQFADLIKLHERFPSAASVGGLEPFSTGLYGSSEMLTDGFIQLMQTDILKRPVYLDLHLQQALHDLASQGVEEPYLHRKASLLLIDSLVAQGAIEKVLTAGDVDYLKSIGVLDQAVALRDGKLCFEAYECAADTTDPDSRAVLEDALFAAELKGGIVAHGGFFLGPDEFYEALRSMSTAERSGICMTSVRFINSLYDHRFGSQQLKAAQRSNARFMNSAMMVTVGGGAISDGLDDGRVVSGVGGQYNFVEMAHQLPGARSVLMLKATRESNGETRSNIVFNYAHQTIPRHLRDIFITEYGIADTRGKQDAEVYAAIIRIADSRFQPELIEQARRVGKLPRNFELEAAYRNNYPATYKHAMQQLDTSFTAETSAFPPFPFDCAFTSTELRVGKALKWLKAATASRRGMMETSVKAWLLKTEPSEIDADALALMAYQGNWNQAEGWKASLKAETEYRLFLLAMRQTDDLNESA